MCKIQGMLFVLYSSQTLTRESAHLIGVSTYGRLKMHCLYVAGSILEFPRKEGVLLWEV